MQRYEYKVIPAPKKAKRAKGVKGADARFAHTLTETMNELATEGWEYQRADTLPVEERAGLTGKHTTFQTLLVFRRPSNIAGLIERHDEFSETAFADEDEGNVVPEDEPDLEDNETEMQDETDNPKP